MPVSRGRAGRGGGGGREGCAEEAAERWHALAWILPALLQVRPAEVAAAQARLRAAFMRQHGRFEGMARLIIDTLAANAAEGCAVPGLVAPVVAVCVGTVVSLPPD